MDQTDVASVHHTEIGSEAAHPGRVFVPSPVMRGEARRTWLSPVWKWLAELLNGPHLVWHRHGAWLGYANLYCQRKALQAYNLFDVGVTMPADRIPVSGYGDPPPMGRTADGSGTDARCPITGMTRVCGIFQNRCRNAVAGWMTASRLILSCYLAWRLRGMARGWVMVVAFTISCWRVSTRIRVVQHW